MSIENLILRLKNAGIGLSLKDDNIELKLGSNDVDETLISEIRKYKSEIVQYLKTNDKNRFVPKIAHAEKADLYLTSHSQKRLWIIDKFEGGSKAYHVPAAFKLEGELNENAFRKSVEKLIERHESLRTIFTEKEDEVYQVILEKGMAHFDYEFVNRSNENISESEYVKDALDFVQQEFDLEKGPLFRVRLIKNKENEHYFFMVMHHIITDGWSVNNFVNDLIHFYQFETKLNLFELDKLDIQYKDYSEWVRKEQNNELTDKAFWKDKLKDLPVLDLTLDKVRPSIQKFDGEQVSLFMNSQESEFIRTFCREKKVSPYVFTFSVLNILLYKYTSQRDLVIGTGLSGRDHKELEDLIGFFVNTIAVRTEIKTELNFTKYLDFFNTNLQEHIEHQNYPLDKIINEISYKRDLSRSAVFDILFHYNGFSHEETGSLPFKFKPIADLDKSSKFDLEISIHEEASGQLKINIQYNTSLFYHETIEKFIEHYRNLLINAISAESKIDEINYLSAEEETLIKNKFNDTNQELKANESIIDIFEENVNKYPESMAIISASECINYKRLNEKVNQFANYLKDEYKVTAEDNISVMMEKSTDLFVSILAILKLGAAYVPIDSKFPLDRQNYMFESSNSKVLITDREVDNDILTCQFPEQNLLSSFSAENIIQKRTLNNLTYIMYTSGSTGKPKGVMIEDKSVIRLVKNTNYAKIEARDRILQLSNYVFDGSVFDIFAAFLNGASLYLIDRETIISGDGLGRYIRENKINISFMTTALFNSLVEEDPEAIASFDKLYFGGENCSVKHIEKALEYRKKTDSIVHVYGPTECTTFSTYYNIHNIDTAKGTVPIGKAITNSNVYVLDSNLKLVGLHVKGEICISGLGLARSYINDKKLNDDKFIDNPFGEGKLYRSGDYGRFDKDGNIEFLGRIDKQVKINGFRIELAEIETVIRSFSSIQDVFVSTVDRGNGVKQIVAYCKSSEIVTEAKLREHLSKFLPSFMIPTYFVFMQDLPLNVNGKIDQSKLPEVRLNNQELIKPRNSDEARIQQIWTQLLKLDEDELSVNANFFEIGGNSINAIKLKSAIHRDFDVELKLNDIFENPSIEQLTKIVKNTTKSKFLEIPKATQQKYYPLSSAQERMFILHQIDESSIGYNMTFALRFNGEFDFEKLKSVLNQLIQRHSGLRTKIEIHNNLPKQRILDVLPIEIKKENIKENEILSSINDFVKPFDILNDEFIRIKLFQINNNDHLVAFDLCHIISDGTSVTNLLKDFITIYSEQELAINRIDYKDFAVWQSDLFQTDYLKKQEQFWLDKFQEIPVLDLPTDYTRTAVQSFEGKTLFFELGEDLTKSLKDLANKTDSTLFMILLSIFNILLHKYSGKNDIVVGTPLIGRVHPDLEKIVGLFLNTLALKNTVNSSSSYESFLALVKENSLESFENQEYPFDDLVDKLKLKRDISRNPIFDCMFNVLNTDNVELPEYNDEKLRISPFDVQGDNTKFDLYFNAYESKKNVHFALGYAARLYKAETIQRLSDHFIEIAKAITVNSNISISKINLLAKNEEREILKTFNDNSEEFNIKTIHEMFEEQVKVSPDNIAVILGDQSISYKELNIKSNQLAHYLCDEFQIETGDFIGICADRNIEMIIGILAIIKAGAAYVAIDPSYPEDRVLHMLEDSNTKLLLSDRNREKLFKNYQSEILNYSEIQDLLKQKLISNLELKNEVNDPIYVVYTSGSTGMPNGAILSHGLLANLLEWQKNVANIDATLSCLQFTSLNFCVSFQEIFSTLSNGGQLYLIDEIERRDTSYLMNFLTKNKIENLYLPFSYLNFLFNEFDEWDKQNDIFLKNIVTAGEQLKISPSLRNFLIKNPDIKLHNHYGSSEIHVVTSYTIDSSNIEVYDIPPVGKPVSNTKIFILDEQMNPCPIGVFGDLYIEGAGAMLGYINNKELTDQKFIPSSINAGQMFYKTGDIGRWLSDGNIEYRGRKDKQLKIRGFRVEPGEIETLIMSCDGIENCVIIDKLDHLNQKYLVAYLVVTDEYNQNALETVLSKRFPAYMIPKIYLLDKIPLMPNGKVDRDALPEPELTESHNDFISARTESEKTLEKIWAKILDLDKVSVHSDFFELGGHSLRASQMISEISRKMNKSLNLAEVFQHSTLEKLAKIIDSKSVNTEDNLITKVELKSEYPISGNQLGVWFDSLTENGNRSYNCDLNFIVTGQFNKNAFESAISDTIERHESLRTNFRMKNGDLIQVVNNSFDLNIRYLDYRNEDYSDADAIAELKADIKIVFDLENDLLIRAFVISLDENRTAVQFVIHHIVTDGWSMGIFVNDLIHFYQKYASKNYLNELEPLRIQQKDISSWITNRIHSEFGTKAQEYWKKVLKEPAERSNFPLDFPRPEIKTYDCLHKHFEISENLAQLVYNCSNELKVSTFVIFVTAIKLVLHKYTSNNDICIGAAVSGRSHFELDNQIGLFVNTILLRSSVAAENTYSELLKEIKENVNKAFEFQDYPSTKILADINYEIERSKSALYDFSIVSNNTDFYSRENSLEHTLEDIKIEQFFENEMKSPDDMTFYVYDDDQGRISFDIAYNKDLFLEESIDLFFNRLSFVLEQSLSDYKIIVSEISLDKIDNSEEMSFDINFEVNL